MIRLIQIEWFKLRHYRPFWILIGMYAVLSTVICSSIMGFLTYLKNEGANFRGIADPTMIPIYDFPDIWQNITWLAAIIKIILAFIVVMSIYNEINHRIVRQNVIDGLSKEEWLASKLIFIAALSAAVTLLLFINGLILGRIYSHPDAFPYALTNLQFLGAYFLDVFTYMTFAMMLALLIRKGGLVIVGLLMYTLMFEPVVSAILYNGPEEFTDWMRVLPDFFPVQSSRNLIHFPFLRYGFQEVQTFVGKRELIIVFCWFVFNVGTSYFMLRKRDI